MAALLVLAAASTAQAGETACWLDNGAIVAPAIVAGVPGDYILDTGAAHTLLHETRAQGAGISDAAISADVRLAGLAFARRPVAVVDLDARTVGFPTAIAGVIGADLLDGLVLDLSFDPCRVGLYRLREAPRFGRGRSWALGRIGGLPATHATATDGVRAATGDFVIATGLGQALALDARFVATRPAKGPGRLRALSFAEDLLDRPSVEITAYGPAAALGAPALRAYRVRIDLAHDRLRLAPAHEKGPPDRPGGP